jgi:hypothetical protein
MMAVAAITMDQRAGSSWTSGSFVACGVMRNRMSSQVPSQRRQLWLALQRLQPNVEDDESLKATNHRLMPLHGRFSLESSQTAAIFTYSKICCLSMLTTAVDPQLVYLSEPRLSHVKLCQT